MIWETKLSLKWRLMGLVMIALIPVVIALVIIAEEQRQQAIQTAHQNSLFLAKLAASNQERFIDGARDILVTLSQVPAIQNNDRAACLFFLRNVLMHYPLYANFGAADRDGNVFCMTLPQKFPLWIGDKTYFQQSITYGNFSISEYQINPVNSQVMITLAYPILKENDSPMGVVFAELDFRWLEQFILLANLPKGVQFRVIDREGKILAVYPLQEDLIGQLISEKELLMNIVALQEGLIEAKDQGGTKRFYAFSPLPAAESNSLFIVVSIPAQAILTQSTQNLVLTLVALLTGACLALIVAWFGSRYLILRQVNELVQATRMLSQGNLSARAVDLHKGDELSELAIAFNEMAHTLEVRQVEQLCSQEQIKKQKDIAETLARIASRLNAQLELQSVFEAVCDEVLGTLRIAAVGVVMIDPSKENYTAYFMSHSVKSETLERLKQLPLAEIISSREEMQPLLLDLRPHLSIVDLSDASMVVELQTLVVFAMKHEEKLTGYLLVFSSNPDWIGADVLTLLQGIADEAALAMMNAQLYQALRIEEKARARL